MIKRAVGISMAFVGVLVGAGFASGQEAMQYFVSFGQMGLWGVVVAAALTTITGIAMLQLGSYFHAREHTAVYSSISGPITSKILDIGTLVTLFSLGFVMFAGAGSNLAQQFEGLPLWVGALLMLALVLATGLLDVDKVTTLIGVITPFIIVLIVSVSSYALLTNDLDLASANDYAVNNVDSPLPFWWLSAINYTGMNMMCAVSMAIVIGGSFLDNRAVGLGGVLGGLITLLLLAMLVSSLLFVAPQVNGTDMPTLALINEINPALGYVMTVAIYGMIFNTAVGMFYAMAKRLTRDKPHMFYTVYVIACVIGFFLSFVGFKALIANVYPVLGYIGIFMMAVMSFAWLRSRRTVKSETDRRLRARQLVARKLDPRKRFTLKNDRELNALASSSNMSMHEFVKFISNDVLDDLESDKELKDFDREDFSPSVTFVQHTKPESAGAVADEGKNGGVQTATVPASADTAALDDANVDLDFDDTTDNPRS
ncbi:hypothetical protein [Corynebacterium stationis]|uniref:YkvI family membrane protein n=1 Tax=Corynebacterium stationis TaxID=1705 RepID=UPI0009EA542A|nr:hypothetical protein [Corynebacterium stationis]